MFIIETSKFEKLGIRLPGGTRAHFPQVPDLILQPPRACCEDRTEVLNSYPSPIHEHEDDAARNMHCTHIHVLYTTLYSTIYILDAVP